MGRGISIHFGINRVSPEHYSGWEGPLNACEADAEDMEAIAKARGFEPRRLVTEQVTRASVRESILQAAGELKAGDSLFVSYSGHGGILPDNDGDESDGQDETWCLYDGELLDDELFALWSKFAAGVRIVVLSDSCHSGTVLRELFSATLARTGAVSAMVPGVTVPVVRAMPRDVALAVYRKNREFYDRLQAEVPKGAARAIQASVLLLSGCQDNQTSLDGAFNGLFTATLLDVWKKGNFKGDYRAFHRAIRKRMPPTQSPNFFRVGAYDPAFERETPFTI
jgi:hypothetical protein